MRAQWVAGCTRAKSLLSRRVGPDGARRLAASVSLEEAVRTLTGTAYGHDVRAGHGLEQAQHAVWASLLWHMRVLAGWQPRGGAAVVRVLAAGFEIANVDNDIRRLAGPSTGPRFDLGILGTAETRLAAADSLSSLRRVMAASAWRDPGTDSASGIAVAMRLVWARRVLARVPEAAEWAAGAAALLVATETFLLRRPLTDRQSLLARRVIGGAERTGSLVEFSRGLPTSARWVLTGISQPADLWRAERAWWRRVDRDGYTLVHGAKFGAGPVVGLVGMLAVDAWRVQAALEVAARGGKPLEAFDAID
ncbi:hypothetical protein GCM10010174_07290 [Kutzneria viridogrisea]|uniref:Uncharacterized protein n=2 Tax=Kutzneria TaxID=43356 RepID=W5WH54_9PSEU|nr:hypothetical protein [Kutzneria albida]AHH97504.1 hypothetical protein KALB_4140 [Kutzneria albida DSM 43870]MBA8930559.1 hypothetical protein [Kutzneria viridogrisea]